jgi:hypothetical protein
LILPTRPPDLPGALSRVDKECFIRSIRPSVPENIRRVKIREKKKATTS